MITFMKGVKRAKMTSRPLSPSWDLAVVLGALCKPPRVRALRLYRQRTLIDFRSLVAQSSLSRYIVEAIRLAYTAGVPVPEGLRAHSSTRAVSAFWALARGAFAQEVCMAANWSSPSTFAVLYNLDIAASSVAHAVLANNSE